MTTTVNAQMWDKTFPKSDRLTAENVSFKNRYNIDVVADIYMSADLDKSKKHPAVDFVGTRPFVDRERIGAIGICGSGGFGVAAAVIDLRIGAIADQRWKEADGAAVRMLVGTPEEMDGNSPEVAKEFYDYYRTPRGRHKNCLTEITYTSSAPMMSFFY